MFASHPLTVSQHRNRSVDSERLEFGPMPMHKQRAENKELERWRRASPHKRNKAEAALRADCEKLVAAQLRSDWTLFGWQRLVRKVHALRTLLQAEGELAWAPVRLTQYLAAGKAQGVSEPQCRADFVRALNTWLTDRQAEVARRGL